MTKILSVIVPALALTFATVQSNEAQAAPHSVRVHVASPVGHKIWVPGHFELTRGKLIWVGGHYKVAPHAKAAWVPGRYVVKHGRKVWVPGHWQ